MKLICTFLSMMILSLSALPCCVDEGACCEEVHLVESAQHSAENHESEPPCSVFFSCGSCTGFNLTSVHFNNIESAVDVSSELMDAVDYGTPQSYHISLLKPPRLA